ncbi:MAG: PAS domain S-box protein, partial [Verrucomicrobia bacterium]|nr:PAS domain S-box protein [Verrucomicrobiota bacterium]
MNYKDQNPGKEPLVEVPQNFPPVPGGVDLHLVGKGPFWIRYGLAIFAVACGVLMGEAIVHSGGLRIFIVFYPLILLVTLYGGLGPGLLAIALSTLTASFLWIQPIGSFAIAAWVDRLSIGIFILGSLLVVWICERLRRAAREASEQALLLRENALRLSLAQKAGQVGVFDWDIRSGKVVWSPELEKLAGLEVGSFEQTYEAWAKHVHPEDVARLTPFFHDWIASERENASWEFRLLPPDGQWRWIEAWGQMVRDSSGQALRVIAANRDVTDRHNAEEALLLRERQLKEAQRLAHLGSWEWDSRTDKATWSEELFHIYGLDPKLPPPPYSERLKLYTPESRTHLDAAVQRAIQTGVSYQLRLEFHRPDQIRKWVSSHGEAVRDKSGSIVGLIGTVQDITESKHAEERLQQSAAELRQIIDLVPHFIFIKDWDGNILLVNQAQAEAYNTTVAEITGKPHAQYHKVESELQRMLRDDREVMETGKTKFIPEESFVDAQGNLRYLQTTKVPFYVAGKVARAVLGVAIDITERKRIEQALSDSENRYRSIFEAVVDAIIIIDERGTIEAVNHATEDLFGYRTEEMIGQNVKMLMPSPYREEHDHYLENYRRTGIKKIIGIGREVRALHKNGSIFPIRLAVSEMRIGNRRMFTGQVHDITARKQAEESIRESEERLRLAQQVARIGTFEWDIATDKNHWAPELEALYGLPKGSFKGTLG